MSAYNNQRMFYRSRALMQAVFDANRLYKAEQISHEELEAVLQGAAQYKSRGHGGKHRPLAHYGFAGSHRNYSHHTPHQGTQEIARRLARIQSCQAA